MRPGWLQLCLLEEELEMVWRKSWKWSESEAPSAGYTSVKGEVLTSRQTQNPLLLLHWVHKHLEDNGFLLFCEQGLGTEMLSLRARQGVWNHQPSRPASTGAKPHPDEHALAHRAKLRLFEVLGCWPPSLENFCSFLHFDHGNKQGVRHIHLHVPSAP